MVLNKQDAYRFADFELHPSKRALLRDDQQVTLAPKSFEILSFLVQNAGRVVTKEEILKAAWPQSFVEVNNLTQHIFWLRKALKDRASYIVTIPGRGYQFTPDVHILHEQALAPSAPFIPRPPRGMSGSIGPTGSDGSTDSTGSTFRIERQSTRTHLVFEETILTPLPSASRLRLANSSWLRPAACAAAFLLLAFVATTIWRARHPIFRGDHHGIVLANFENSTGDQGFDHALTTLLAIDLNQSPYLVISPESDTRKVLGLMSRNPAESLTTSLALEVCQRLNDQVVLSGLIATFGNKYLVTLTAADCQTGEYLVSTKAVASDRDAVLKAVDTVAADMRGRLGESLKSFTGPAVPLQLAHTFSLDALRMYSQGLALQVNGRYQEAAPLYQQAIQLDPLFAAAHLQLGLDDHSMGEYQAARTEITRAYDLRDQGDEYLKLRIISEYNGSVTADLRAQLRNLTAWTRMYPTQPQPWIDLAIQFESLAQFDDALAPARQGLALAPNYPVAYAELCGALFRSGRVEQARQTCQQAVQKQIDSAEIHQILHAIAYVQHDSAALATEEAWVKGTDEEIVYPTRMLFAEGKTHEAVARWLLNSDRARIQGLEERADHRLTSLMHREADYNMHAELKEQLKRLSPAWNSDINVIIANAELGRIPAADAGLKLMIATRSGTMYREFYIPEARAAIDLARHNPEQAITDLEPTRPFDLSGLEALLLRGRAYLAAGRAKEAEEAFNKVINHPWDGAGEPSNSLAHLGLAEALEREGNHPAARREYQTLFQIWKNADPDLPPLHRARSEYAAIP